MPWTEGMLSLIDYISTSSLASGLYAWTSMFDLCITQSPAAYPYNGPFLRVSPQPDGQLEFRYVDTAVAERQWSRLVRPQDAVDRFNRFLEQLSWFKDPSHEA